MGISEISLPSKPLIGVPRGRIVLCRALWYIWGHERTVDMWQEMEAHIRETTVAGEYLQFFLAKEFLVGRWQWLTNAKSLCKLHRDKEDWPTRRRWDHYHPFLPLGFQDEAYFVHLDVGQGPRMFALRQTKSFPLQRMWKSFVRNLSNFCDNGTGHHSRHLSEQLLLW